MGVREQNKRNSILLGQGSNSLVWLIITNVVMFVLLWFIQFIYRLSYESDAGLANALFESQVLKWMVLPGAPGILFSRPWTILSYMFSQTGFWSLLSNMLWLWAFGYILQDLTGSRKIIPIYLYGGVAGALFFIAAYNFFPGGNGTASLAGAGAAVMCVATATTTLAPGYRIFPMINGGIALWILMVIFAALDFAFVVGAGSAIAMAHLGGAVIGFFFIRQLRIGNDWGLWMNTVAGWAENLFNPSEKERNTLRQYQHHRNTTSHKGQPNASQQRIDEILDKINQKGYQHLSEEDKAVLKEAAEEGK